MGVSLEQMRELIFTKVGQGLEGDDAIDQMLIDKVAPQFGVIWAKWEWKNFYPQLQALYVERECVEVLMGQLRDVTDTKLGANLTTSQSDIFRNLQVLHNRVSVEIQQAEYAAIAARAPVITKMKSSQDMEGRPWLPNPASPRYRGDPRYPYYYDYYS